MIASRIRVTGIVQGVGFRPFVWRLARELDLHGWVRNDGEGVEIAAEGEAEPMRALLERLAREAPALARVDAVTARAAAPAGCGSFFIADSQAGPAQTAIGPDTAPCADCLAELFDPGDRRHRHAFITCTHCGPRYTVTRGLPYDRARTSLAPFPLCPACAREYLDPGDRRFHAETNCCPACGPRLILRDAQGGALAGDPIAETLGLIRAGGIVAIKGVGGFHLVCAADDAAAVARLRLRKAREEKPFALLLSNAASVSEHAEVGEAEAAWLDCPERPIVLLRKRAGCGHRLAGVAPGLAWLGTMLPATPIQYLLFHEAAGRPAGSDWLAAPQPLALVATSANPGGEPLVRDNDEALSRLSGIADAFLTHDRDIVARCDDSVLRGGRFIRRARGFTPRAIRLAHAGPSALAMGGALKNTVCVTRGDEAFVSQHIGDLDNAAACIFHRESVARLIELLGATPEIVACDLHPDFYSSRFAAEYADSKRLPLVAVQHHHAHIAAVLAEHGHQGPVLGLAADGFGLGSDGAAWGGELLRVDGRHCRRLGHISPLPLPGGDRAAREPWRMAASALFELGRAGEIERRFAGRGGAILAQMLARGLNSPRTSSAGRWFDAAAGLLGVRETCSYEGQAAMLLEGLAEAHGPAAPADDAYAIGADGTLDLLPLLAHLAGQPDRGYGAAVFHSTLAAALGDWVRGASERTGLRKVALGGGCFSNRILAADLRARLEAAGLAVFEARQVPPNDGGLALGQAAVALQWAAG
ncbi:MAG TPA: carbamoyltransferase HypF [Rhodocyclaceae bacterium]|nr:carbamoyltransferase HypF [Rhodocyclaceae bacterium]